MKRRHSVLSMELFEKALEGYTELGGGPVTFTPVVGDILLDPYLIHRFNKLEVFPAITDISFTTNMIGHERLSDENWAAILGRLRYLQVSIGGYDAHTYHKMFGVDAFDDVWEGIHRIAAIKKNINAETRLSVTLRSPEVEKLLQGEKTEMLRNIGYNQVSGISSFGNWCGDVDERNMPTNTRINPPVEKAYCCSMPALFMAVLSDGRVTGCSCVDHDGILEIGDLHEESLHSIWHGMSRRELCLSFEKSKLSRICVDCSSYSSVDTISGMPFCDGLNAKHLSTAFYDDFSGG